MRKIINNNIFNKMRVNIKLLNQFNQTPELESQIVIGLTSASDTPGKLKGNLLSKHSNKHRSESVQNPQPRYLEHSISHLIFKQL